MRVTCLFLAHAQLHAASAQQHNAAQPNDHSNLPRLLAFYRFDTMAPRAHSPNVVNRLRLHTPSRETAFCQPRVVRVSARTGCNRNLG